MTRPRTVMLIPFELAPDPVAWCGGAPVAAWAAAAEAAGFDAVAVTDHPFPSDEWLPTGHQAFDPFVLLTAFASATERIRLLTDIIVAGYRNPYLLAKSVASLDVVSGGRLVLGMGAGYQRAEFDALGASFTDRGKRFDAALESLYAALGGESVSATGGYFPAAGNTALPRPVQQPHPPVWIGGNSDAAIRRAVHLAEGWMPFPQPRSRVAISGSPALGSLEELKPRIERAQEERAATGRPPLDICSGIFGRFDDADLPDVLEEYGRAGVSWITLTAPGATMAESIARMESLAAALLH
jgi:probable F420-dependent oxidoreductase